MARDYVSYSCSINTVPFKANGQFIPPKSEQKVEDASQQTFPVKSEQVGETVEFSTSVPEVELTPTELPSNEISQTAQFGALTDIYGPQQLPVRKTISFGGKDYNFCLNEQVREDGTKLVMGFNPETNQQYQCSYDKDGNKMLESIAVMKNGNILSSEVYDYVNNRRSVNTFNSDFNNVGEMISRNYDLSTNEELPATRNTSTMLFKNETGYIDKDGKFQSTGNILYNGSYNSEFGNNVATALNEQEARPNQEVAQTPASTTQFGNLTTQKSESPTAQMVAAESVETKMASETQTLDSQAAEISEQSTGTSSGDSGSKVVLDGDNTYKQLVAEFQLKENGGYDEDDARIFAGKYLQYLEKGYSTEQAEIMAQEYAQTYTEAINDVRFNAKAINQYMKSYNSFILQGKTSEDSKNLAFQKISQ